MATDRQDSRSDFESDGVELSAFHVALYMLSAVVCLELFVFVTGREVLHLLGVLCTLPFWLAALRGLRGSAEDRKRVLTWANLVTFFRLGLLSAFTFCALSVEPGPWLSAAMIGFLGLDYLDGFLARSLDQSSRFGGFLDEETDALTVLCIVYYVHRLRIFTFPGSSLFVLLPGFNHYLFIGIKRTCGIQWPPRQWWPRFLAGFCWLLGAAGFACAPPLRDLMLFSASLGNNFSFALSYYQMFFPATVPAARA